MPVCVRSCVVSAVSVDVTIMRRPWTQLYGYILEWTVTEMLSVHCSVFIGRVITCWKNCR